MTTLEQLRADIDSDIAVSTNPNLTTVLMLIKRLAGEVAAQVPVSPSGPLSDQVTNLTIEIGNLKTQLAAAQKATDDANRFNNEANDQLHQIAAALHAEDLTIVQLVTRAGEIWTELDNRRKGKL